MCLCQVGCYSLPRQYHLTRLLSYIWPILHPSSTCDCTEFRNRWGVAHGSIFCLGLFFRGAEKGTQSLAHARKALPAPWLYPSMVFWILFACCRRYPCGSDVLVGLRIPGLHQWFSNFVPHPQFLTREHEPGLAFAFCTNFPHFGVAALRRLPFKNRYEL